MPDQTSRPWSDPAEAAAAEWFIRRDRGLGESEQADFLQWRRASPRHEAALARIEQVWKALDPVFEFHAATAAAPDPDLLAPPRRRSFRRWIPWAVAAAAAAAAFVFYPRVPDLPARAQPRVIVHPGPQRLNLEDGSVVELNGQAKVDVHFTSAERRITLVRGEAFFTVAKNPARPFLVSADRVTVRAVGTAFSVGLDQREVSVLVTDGRVGVNEVRPNPEAAPSAPRELSALVAGQQGVVSFPASPGADGRAQMTVTRLTPAQIERALSWQGVRLEFTDMSLGDIVADFNHYNRRQLVVPDAATAAIRVGGNFRADRVDDFVRLLAVGFGVSAFPRGEEIILRRTHDH